MYSVWKPEKDPPHLDKYCHLSHDAQRVMLALYSDYLQCRSEVLETKRMASNSKGYYQSMYEEKFGHSVDGRHQQLASNTLAHDVAMQHGFTPDLGTENSASGSENTNFPARLPGRNTSHTARRLDFDNQMNSSVRSSYIQRERVQQLPVNAFDNVHKLINERKSALHQHTKSPESSNYSDSPPIETHDFRILSQFQRDNDTLDELESLTEEAQQSTTGDEEHFSIDKTTSGTAVQSCSNDTETWMKSAEINLHDSCSNIKHMIVKRNTKASSIDSNLYLDNGKANIHSSPEKELTGSQSLFSQDVSNSRGRTAKKNPERKTVQKHCVTLQKSYQSNSNSTFKDSLKNSKKYIKETPISNTNIDTLADENMPLEFSKKLVVSPQTNIEESEKNKVDFSIGIQQTVQFKFKPVLSTDINKRSFEDLNIQSAIAGVCMHPSNEKSKAPAVYGTCRDNDNEVLIQENLNVDQNNMEEENPLSCIGKVLTSRRVTDNSYMKKTSATYIRNTTSDAATEKMYPIFSKPSAVNQQRSSSSLLTEQGKRKSKTSQSFDAPFKKQKKADNAYDQDKQVASLPSRLNNIESLSPSELSSVLSSFLSAEEVILILVYTDNSTQLRHSLFGQETKKRTGRQKSSTSAKVSSVAVGIKTDHYKDIYIFPTEKHIFYKTRDFWKSLMGSQTKKIGFRTKSLFTELMLLNDFITVADWHVLDAGIAVWLLNSDKPVSTFEQLLTQYGFPQQIPCDSSTKALPDDMLLLSNVVEKLTKDLRQQELLPLFHEVECRLTPLLAAMEQRDLHVATHTLLKFSEILKKKLQKLEQQAHQAAGHPFLLSSHAQLRQVLFETLRLDTKLPKQAKLAKTTVGREKSTSEAVLTQLSPHHPLPAIVLEHRQLLKLKSTYIDGILSCVNEGRLQTHWDQTAAATGRLTAYQPNIQAIPKAPVTIEGYTDNFIVGKEKGDKVELYARDCFISPPGYSLMAADFQQIELRLLGHLTKDPVLIKIFNDPEVPDIFNALTAEWLGKTADSVTTSEREQTKRVVYSVMYGAGKDKLAEYLKISPDNAKAIINSFLLKFPAVNQFTSACVDYCRKHGYTRTILKRKRLFSNIRHPSPALRAQAERQCVNFCVQGSAADLCKAAMLQVEQALAKKPELKARLLVQIHDELLFEVADSDIEEITVLVTSVMECCDKYMGAQLSLHVPLAVSISVGKKWGHLQPISTTDQQR